MRARTARQIFTRISTGFRQRVKRFVRDRGGNVATIVAIMALPLAGAMGMAAEGSSWYLANRSMQNAADAAVLAAAANNGASYNTEAQLVAQNAGFTNGGADNTVVSATVGPLPAYALCTIRCYQVKISRDMPTYLLQAVGYPSTQTISAFAVAKPKDLIYFCILALSPNGNGIDARGTPKADLNGCDVASNGNANCTGGNGLQAAHVVAVGNISGGCGNINIPNGPVTADPYASRAANIPDVTCPNSGTANAYPQISQGAMPTKISGTPAWGGAVPKQLCGDVQLIGNVTINSDTVLVIQNGILDLNGFTLQTAPGAGLTIIFSCGATGHSPVSAGACPNIPKGGNPQFDPQHYPINGGTLDIAAPTSGTWSGVALYQDPLSASGVSFTYSGNTPTWDITGLIYLPKADLNFNGIINKSSNGLSCLTLVANTITVKGTGKLFYANAQSQCVAAGLTQVTGTSGRQYLVY